MPLPPYPQRLSADLIQTEFGRKSNEFWKIGDYRRSISVGGRDWPVDDGIPSGSNDTIRFSDFHSKQHNIVILMSGNTAYRQRMLSDNTSITSTGYRSTNSSVRRTSKNIVYVIKKIGSAQGSRVTCALRTQNNNRWFNGSPNGAKVLIIIGNGGEILGAGGRGGNGRKYNKQGDKGENGTSALGLEIEVESIEVEEGGLIVAGGGGGGGGGGGRETSFRDRRACGGGGGGGAGFPRGEGGKSNDEGKDGDPGGDGSQTNGGAGGEGGENDNEAHGGSGGGGGSAHPNGSPGTSASGEGRSRTNGSSGSTNGDGGEGGDGDGSGEDNGGESPGGDGGKGGYAITRQPGISSPTINGSSRVHGRTNNAGVD